MAMKKSEMELHSRLYHEKLRGAATAESAGMYRAALDAAVAAWQHIDGMMQYERKYEGKEFTSIPAIDLALKYAPLLLDMRRLDALDDLLGEYKRIDRHASDDIQSKVEQARARVWENHRLWSYIEHHPGAPQEGLQGELGGIQSYWRSVAEAWSRMGLLARTAAGRSYTLSLATRMGEVVPAKCPACGHVAESPKGMFLEQLTCPECRASVVFVLLARQRHTVGEA